MSSTSHVTLYPGRARVRLSAEGIVYLLLNLFSFTLAYALQWEILWLCSCIALSFPLVLFWALPRTITEVELHFDLPSAFQAGQWSAYGLSLKLQSKTLRFPCMSVRCHYSGSSSSGMLSTKASVGEMLSNQSCSFRLRIKPEQQGEIVLDKIELSCRAGLKLIDWGLMLPVSQHCLVHPRDLALEDFDLASDTMEPLASSHQKIQANLGDEVMGSLREYTPMDHFTAIDWRRLARQPCDPMVRTPLPTFSERVVLVLDTGLKIRKKGSAVKMVTLCEFMKALAQQMLEQGAELEVWICTEQRLVIEMAQPEAWSIFCDTLSLVQLRGESVLSSHIVELSQQVQSHKIVVSLETHQGLLRYTEIQNITHSSILNDVISKHNIGDV